MIQALANLLDLPGSMVRDVATWMPGGTPAQNPLDQLLSPFSEDGRISGRGLLRGAGMVGNEDNWGNFAGGLGLETLLDPMTYLTMGALPMLKTAGQGLAKGAKAAGSMISPELANLAEQGLQSAASGARQAGGWAAGKASEGMQAAKQGLGGVMDYMLPARDVPIPGPTIARTPQLESVLQSGVAPDDFTRSMAFTMGPDLTASMPASQAFGRSLQNGIVGQTADTFRNLSPASKQRLGFTGVVGANAMEQDAPPPPMGMTQDSYSSSPMRHLTGMDDIDSLKAQQKAMNARVKAAQAMKTLSDLKMY